MKHIDPHTARDEFNDAWQFLKAHLPLSDDEEYIESFCDDIQTYERSRKTRLGVELAVMLLKYLGECIDKEGEL